jgi:hypothetical protein
MPTSAAMIPASGMTAKNGSSKRPARAAVAYPPTARKAALPSEICPVEPVRRFKPIAPMTAMPVRQRTSSQ